MVTQRVINHTDGGQQMSASLKAMETEHKGRNWSRPPTTARTCFIASHEDLAETTEVAFRLPNNSDDDGSLEKMEQCSNEGYEVNP